MLSRSQLLNQKSSAKSQPINQNWTIWELKRKNLTVNWKHLNSKRQENLKNLGIFNATTMILARKKMSFGKISLHMKRIWTI